MFGFFKKQALIVTGKTTLLRLPVSHDFEVWKELRVLSRSELAHYEPRWDSHELSRQAFNARVRQAKILAEIQEAFQFFIFEKAGHVLLGGITLGNIRRGAAQTGEIGYWLGTQYYGQGYMRDAVSAVLKYSFSTLRLHRIEAACIQSNIRSIALLQHCGFHYEGYARAYLEINGKRQDHHLYACLPSDIPTLRS